MISDAENLVLEVAREHGPLTAYRRMITENNALIRGAELDNGRAIAEARTAIHTALVGRWAEEQHRALGNDKAFAVVALGGTGRGEMTPCSDLDLAFLFEEAIDGNPFLLELQRKTLHTDEFREQYGFRFEALPFGLDDVPDLEGKSLNSFLDMRPVFDPTRLAERFRERIRATYDPFEYFLHVRKFWNAQWEAAALASERLDRFDIKNDGLRPFLGGIWTIAGKSFTHSHEVYEALEDPRDLEAYDFLLRIRAWIHSRRPPGGRSGALGNHPEDVLRFEDFISFGEMLGTESDEFTRFEFANKVRSRLLSARRRVAAFARSVIERELRHGRAVAARSPLVYGYGGLYHSASDQCRTDRDKSRAALALLHASQRYGLPIAPSELDATFRNAGDWLVRVPELLDVFYEPRGSLADSFEFLARLDGAEERLFPGYGPFESSLDGRVMSERRALRSALERQKMRTLERYVAEGSERLRADVSSARLASTDESATVAIHAALLDSDHLAAVKLALKTKRLPLTVADRAARDDATLPLLERHASGFSGIPLAEYYASFVAECGFTPATVEIAAFLVAQRRSFKEHAESGQNDERSVQEFAQLCGNAEQLRALFIFTCADRAEWESDQADPVRWWNIRELYTKTFATFHPRDRSDALQSAGYDKAELNVLRDFGTDFFSGLYRHHAIRFGAHLVGLAEDDAVGPRAGVIREGTSTMLAVAARDYRGLAASISGALWHSGVDLRQAHLFSAMNYGLALDFFHLAPGEKPLPPDLSQTIEEAIRATRHIADNDEAGLPRFDGRLILTEPRPGQHCLRFETTRETGGLIYALTYKVFRYLEGNIHGLTAHTARGHAYISIYHSLPPGRSLEEAQAIVEDRF